MAEPISIMEDFVKDLLKENIIQTYKADRVEVRNFYNNNYRTIAKCSFHEFNWGLWQYWYVNSFTKTVIFFDQRWIDYFALDVGGNCGSKTPFNEKAYVDERKCLLCNVSFADQESYKIHLEWLHHKIRMQYVKNKGSFTTNKDITLEIAEKSPAPSKLQFPVKTDINATLCIRNTSKKDVNVMEVIMVNSLITDITVHEAFDKGVLLGPSETAKMNLHAYFEHSTTLLYPVVVVTEAKGSKQNILHLKQIEVEVTSEFSSLTPDSKYISKSPDAFSVFFDMMNAVVPGLRPDPYMSYYKETLPLRQFKIPEDIDLIFQDLVASYPEFVNRGTPTVLHYQTFRSRLNIPRGKLDVDNYFSKLDMLLHVEENQMRVDVRDYDTTAELKEIKDKKGNILYELQVPGLAEARPSLLVGDKVFIKESKQDFVKFEGIVHKVLEISVVLGLNQRFTKVFLPGKKFFIEFGFNRRPIRVEKQALFLANSHEIIPSLFPEKVEIRLLSAIPNGLQISNRQLNDEQRMSVNSIMKPKNYPFLIFGPPGTGKTVTIVESVYQLWKNYPNSKILVCAPSNAATNEVAARLIKIVPKSDMYRLLGSVYANDNDRLGEIKDIVNIKGDEFFMPSMDDLLKCRVVMTTIITAARLVNGGVPEGHYTHVFIDESGYATETQTLIPIAGILSNAATQGKLSGQIILAGDPRQLGPLVHSNFARYCGYGTSLLERLLKTCDLYSRDDEKNNYNSGCVTKLVKNYRSHETILKVPNELFYDNELIAAGNDFTDAFIGWENLKNEKFPIIFHHVEGEDARDKTSPSFFNVQEIEQVMDYLSQLIGSKASGMKINEKHIGVITPYRKQAEKLKEACSRKKWDSLLVGSVEQFQGKERLVVIISTVRSKNANKFEQIDQKCQLGFLKNPKRFNVALTRAKALLIVVGNANVLQTDNNWSSFIRYCKENKSVSGKRFTLASSR